jgi:hypothetical protein
MSRFLRSAIGLTLVSATVALPQYVVASEQEARNAPFRVEQVIHQREEAHHSAIAGGSPLPGITRNFEVLDHVWLGGKAADGDVAFFNHGRDVGRFAYVGTWGPPCIGRGVKIIDVTRPRRAELVAVAGHASGTTYEDMDLVRIGRKVVLGVGLQDCNGTGRTGIQLFNVTNPRRPRALSFVEVPAGGVHELDLVVTPSGQALALLAVPFVEFLNTYLPHIDRGGELRIVDISDPTNPIELASWGIIADSSLPIFGGNDEISESFQGIGYYATHYAHSVRAADRGETAYVSYWDGGVLKFDMQDPSNPQLLGRTIYPIDADGDAHSLAIKNVDGVRYLFQNDEDFEALSPVVVTSSETGPEQFAGIEEPWMPTVLLETGEVSGEVFDAGDGCEATDFDGASGRIALADVTDPSYFGVIPRWSIPCDIAKPILNAAASGASALLVNVISPGDASPFRPVSGADVARIQTEAKGMPVALISSIDELADQLRAAPANQPPTVTLTPQAPGWGYVRIFRETETDTDGDGVFEFEQVGEMSALPHVKGEYPGPVGTWSVHNTEVIRNRAFSSWYAHGVVAWDLSDPTQPVRVGRFARASSARSSTFGDEAFPQVWGVAIDKARRIVYASDMRSGLWIVRPTGPADW